MTEARRELRWQMLHRQTLDIINSQRAKRDQIKTLFYPYCNVKMVYDRLASEEENAAWLMDLAKNYNLKVEDSKNG